MATVAATLASGGVRHWPNFVQRITDDRARVVYDGSSDPAERVLAPDVVACETDILHDVVQRGTGTNAQLADNRPVAGKTGTTDGKSDANFLGFTPDLAAFVWYGNPKSRVPGAGFGGEVPARIFKAFMDSALAGTEPSLFPDPGPVCARPPTQPVPEGTINSEPNAERPQQAAPVEPAPVQPAPAPLPTPTNPPVTTPPPSTPSPTSPPQTSPPPSHPPNTSAGGT
jgi:membrane peptidoglycan carboxypeptidase